jgi:glycosyltransferase involved in cell wall biosynthesis
MVDAVKLTMALEGKRVLFISYNGMLDPLGQSQVIPYLRELSQKGIRFTLLSFERAAAFEPAGRSRSEGLRESLAADDIEWHWLRYHQKPSLPATIYDVLAGTHYATRLVRGNGIEMVHARSHIPATIALALKRRFGVKMIFDIRGLMAEEYVDAEHWRQGSIPFRLTKTMERRALAASDGVVTLTERIWPLIEDWDGLRGRQVIHEVIPCCADLQLYKFSCEERARRRAELGLGNRSTIVYSGSIDGWYLTDKMVDFFAQVLRNRPSAYFLWLTPSRHNRIRSLMSGRGIEPSNYTVQSVAGCDVPSYLAAGDAGLAFIKPCFSKLASSPTKNAEYLACGLPLIINAGIGDSDALIMSEKTGALVSEFTDAEYEKAFARIEDLARNSEDTRRRARGVAEKLFDVRGVGVERYARLYERVLAS